MLVVAGAVDRRLEVVLVAELAVGTRERVGKVREERGRAAHKVRTVHLVLVLGVVGLCDLG